MQGLKGLEGISQVDKAFGREDEWFKNKPNLAPIMLGKDLVAEEQYELLEELNNESLDVLHIAKEMADVIVVIQNLAKRLGIDLNIALDLVNNSNLSKLCYDPEKALTYGQLKYPGKSLSIKKLDNNTYVLYDTDSGKFLKGYGYQEPNMAPACKVPNIQLEEKEDESR